MGIWKAGGGSAHHFLIGAFDVIVRRCAGDVEGLVVVFAHGVVDKR